MKREDGQTMAEYGVTLTAITLGVIAAFTLLAQHIVGAVERVVEILS